MLSRDWKYLFDSSLIPSPKQVFGDKHTAMFVCEDERVFAIGKGLTGPQDIGWLREISKPPECRGFKKVLHNHKVRMILTEEGRIFINGKSTSWKGLASLDQTAIRN